MKSYLALFFLLSTHLFLLTRLAFTAWPEMLSYPYLLSNGFKLYQDIALPYQPVLIFILSTVYKVFGYSVLNLQIFTWTLILLNDLLIFLIVKKIAKLNAALLAVFFYITFQTFSDGNTLWFDLAATPFILGGLATFFYIKSMYKYIAFGLLLSLASFTKQQVALTVIFIFSLLIFLRNFKNALYFFLGAIIPGSIILAYVLSNSMLKDYFFWTFEVPLVWYPKAQGYVHLPSSSEWNKVLLMFLPVILALIYFKRWTKDTMVIFLILIATFITSFPRFEFFRMQPTIALIALFVGILTSWSKLYQWLLLFIVAGYLISNLPSNFLEKGTIRFFSEDDFKIAELIKSKSASEEKIYLLGLPSSQYIYTNKLTSKPWVDNYIWYMEIPEIQQKVIDGLIKEDIKYIFWKEPQKGQWFELDSYQPRTIVDYIRNNYSQVESFEDIKIWKKRD